MSFVNKSFLIKQTPRKLKIDVNNEIKRNYSEFFQFTPKFDQSHLNPLVVRSTRSLTKEKSVNRSKSSNKLFEQRKDSFKNSDDYQVLKQTELEWVAPKMMNQKGLTRIVQPQFYPMRKLYESQQKRFLPSVYTENSDDFSPVRLSLYQ